MLSLVAPGGPLPAARADDDRAPRPVPGCGHEWRSAEMIGHLPGGLTEVSGFASSARYPGVAWMIRDSGNPHSLYTFTLAGDRPQWREIPVSGVSNRDWEDVAYSIGSDGRGRVWILENDFGTAQGRLYEVLEPDPDQAGSVRVANTYRFDYPGGYVNTEALFSVGDHLMLVSRTSPNRVYRLPATLSRTGTNQATAVDHLDAGSLLTAAGTSGDDRLLATIGIMDEVRVFENPTGASEFGAFATDDVVFHEKMPDSQRESIDFFPYNGCDIISVSEDGTVWRLANPRSIQPAGVPGAPNAVTVTPGDGFATVSWAPPATTGHSPVTAYRVSAFHDGLNVATVTTPDGTTTSTLVSGLGNGVAYSFRVTALNAAGAGPASPPVAATPPVATAPPPPAGPADPPVTALSVDGTGYWMLGAGGAVYGFGAARFEGEPAGVSPGVAATDLEPTPSGRGYWVVNDHGRVFAFGDARHLGEVGRPVLLPGESATSLSATPDGAGYWIFTSRGRAFPFGTAARLGDMTQARLNAPVLDSVATATGAGYWMVASDGGIFAFGDAGFFGSMGGRPLNAAVRSLVPDPDAAGYWLVASDGGVFAFEAPFRGSMGGAPLNRPVAGMVAFGNGYLMVGEDGGAFNFSDRSFHGSLGGRALPAPIVAVAAID